MNQRLKEVKLLLVNNIQEKINEKAIESTKAKLLIKLINNAETITEAISIAKLEMVCRKSGFYFDTKIFNISQNIKYLKKNETLSFTDGSNNKNSLIIGDNYDALLNLLITYKGMIDVIYIDPPYGSDSTGKYANTNYTNSISRNNLLSMLYPRLIIAKELLSEDGVIFVSIDDKNQAHIKCLMDEIFNEENFICNLIWQTKSGAKGIPPKRMCVVNCEYILTYSKSEKFKFIGEARSKEEGFSNPDNDKRGPWKRQYLQRFGQGFPVRTITNPQNGMVFSFETPYTEEKMNNWIKENIIVFPNTPNKYPLKKEFFYEYSNPYKPILTNLGLFTTKTNTQKLKSIFNGKKVFEYSKPVDLMKDLLLKSTHKNAIILDFFAGSGTTGQAVLELNKEDGGNRKFILCTNNEITKVNPNGIAYDVTSKRLKRVMTGQCYDGSSDFEWIKKNDALGGTLDVYEIAIIDDIEKINEIDYGLEKFNTKEEKEKWVYENFENAKNFFE